MKNDLTCGVVRDLLPSYVENLLGDESRQAVDRHLEGCPECSAQKDTMTAQAVVTAQTQKEVDYLKRVKRANRKRIIISVFATAVGLVSALLLKVFVIGTPVQGNAGYLVAEAHENDNVLYVSISTTNSADAYHSWKVEKVDGIVSIYARSVLVSPLFSTGGGNVSIYLDSVDEVWLGGTSGKLIWKDGLVISWKTDRLLDRKVPYCGDAPALGRLLNHLQLQQQLGSFSISLHTSSKPYGLTLEFQEDLNNEAWEKLRVYECLILALVENLDEVTYTCQLQDASGGYEDRGRNARMTAEDASFVLARLTEKYNEIHLTDWPVHENIKEYAENPLELQRMITLLNNNFDINTLMEDDFE